MGKHEFALLYYAIYPALCTECKWGGKKKKKKSFFLFSPSSNKGLKTEGAQQNEAVL